MTNTDIQKEVQRLREQLQEMKREREAEQESTRQSADEEMPRDANSIFDEVAGAMGGNGSEDLIGQFKELLNSIDEDIKDTRPTTLLVVFALGVLVGRL